jgi:hypothetical protein
MKAHDAIDWLLPQIWRFADERLQVNGVAQQPGFATVLLVVGMYSTHFIHLPGECPEPNWL